MQESAQSTTTRHRKSRLVLAALWGLILWVSPAGLATWNIDYGRHWDEPRAIDKAQRSAVEGSLLPGIYIYPSVMHDITLLTMLPELVTGDASQEAFWTAEFRHQLLLRARTAMAWITMFAIVIVAVLTRFVTRDRWATLIAPLMLATSFEYAYHARFLAPDGILATFGIIALSTLLVASLRKSVRWLIVGSAIAGLACGAKYPGGILLLPALLLARELEPPGRRRRRALLCVAAFSGVFLLTTPGAIFDIDPLATQVWKEIRVYASGHGSYTTASPIHHFGKVISYLGTVFPSQHRLAGLAMAIPMVWGVVALYRRSRAIFNVLGVTLIAYVFYFASQKVMIVRNYLLVMPILAVMMGVGIAEVRRRTPRFVGIR